MAKQNLKKEIKKIRKILDRTIKKLSKENKQAWNYASEADVYLSRAERSL